MNIIETIDATIKEYLNKQNLLYEYSDKIKNQLINKFKKENPNLVLNNISYYIERFAELKNSPKIKEKNIFKYSWKELENIVDSQKIIKKNKPIVDGKPVYNNNGMRIYAGDTEEGCVKYGSGYSWCISSRGEGNMYDYYRYGHNVSIYFVFDDNRTSERDENNNFVDPFHSIVVMVNELDEDDYEYVVTLADNDGEETFYSFNALTKVFPKLEGLKKIFKTQKPIESEKNRYEIKKDFEEKISKLQRKYYDIIGDDTINVDYFGMDVEIIDNLLNGKIKPIKFIVKLDDDYDHDDDSSTIHQIHFIGRDGLTYDKAKKSLYDNLKELFPNTFSIEKDNIYNLVDITEKRIDLLNQRELLIKARELMLEYRNKLNKVNIK